MALKIFGMRPMEGPASRVMILHVKTGSQIALYSEEWTDGQ